VSSSREQIKLGILATCVLIASSSLLFFGTGPYPVWWLAWFAPLPVLVIAPRIGALPAFGIAALSWFVGDLNMWHNIRSVLNIPLGVAPLLLILPSCVFGIIVLVHRLLIRRGALWQAALIVPIMWVSYEYLMSIAPPPRTLVSIGYSQMDWLPVFHLASLAGIWGISFSLFLVPASIAALLTKQGDRVQMVKILSVAIGGLLIIAILHWAWNRHVDYSAERQDTLDYRQIFSRSEIMIPMRDGVRLHTEIYTPNGIKEPMPFLLERGNGSLESDATHYSRRLARYTEMFPDEYIFVFQEIRGRYSSEGQFVMLRPPRDPSDPNAIDEATDAYDTIDWLVRNVPNNNGRAGLIGISYGGWLATMALLDPHPALKAISEQDSPADMFLGDDFHHNGAFRLSYGFEYTADLESSRKLFGFPFDKHDTYDWYFDLGPLSNVNALYFHDKLPTWNNFVEHPNYDEYWKSQAFHRYLSELKPTVPNLNVAGWWDQEDFYGPLEIYEDLEAHDTDHINYLVIGPWNHGGMVSPRGTKLSVVDLGSDTGPFFRQKLQAPWFAFWLHGRGTLPLKEAMIFETGSNQWKDYDTWPPQIGTTRRKLYFRAHGQLSFDPPQETTEAFDSYISDPANPVPYRHRPVEATYSSGSRWYTWLLEDQRFVQGRPDVLTWSTGPLTEDVTLSGDIVAHLFASTTGTDSDWIVKLIDVYPGEYPQDPKLEGYELIISDEVFRGRFYESFEHPKPLVPNQVVLFTIDLHTNDHTFLKGHRILVQVQSTWFPLIDRNPQTYVPNIFKATAADYQRTTQRIYRSLQLPSNIEIPIHTPQ
jgi:putative CocE/NonD family hydrolase